MGTDTAAWRKALAQQAALKRRTRYRARTKWSRAQPVIIKYPPSRDKS